MSTEITTNLTFEQLKEKYADAEFIVEVGKGKAGFLKIDNISGVNQDEKLKVAFHMIKNPIYALANKDGQIISEVKLGKGDVLNVLQAAKEESAQDKAKISSLEERLAEYERRENEEKEAKAAEENLQNDNAVIDESQNTGSDKAEIVVYAKKAEKAEKAEAKKAEKK